MSQTLSSQFSVFSLNCIFRSFFFLFSFFNIIQLVGMPLADAAVATAVDAIAIELNVKMNKQTNKQTVRTSMIMCFNIRAV